MFGLKMPKKLNKGSIILFVLAAAITGFTSLKTIDLLRFTMPPDQAPFAWFGWACFEGGLAAWIYWSGQGARRDQRGIAQLMVWFNLIAVVIAFFADTILVVARKGGVSVDQNGLTWTVIIAVGVVVTANLVAVVGTHQEDPDMKRRIKQEEYQEALDEAEEEANHQIEIERLKYITKNAAAIAPHIGFQQGADWTQQKYQQWALPGQQPPALPAPTTQQNQSSIMSSQSSSLYESIEQLYNENPQRFAELVKHVQQQQSPLQQPQMKADQAGTNGQNGH